MNDTERYIKDRATVMSIIKYALIQFIKLLFGFDSFDLFFKTVVLGGASGQHGAK